MSAAPAGIAGNLSSVQSQVLLAPGPLRVRRCRDAVVAVVKRLVGRRPYAPLRVGEMPIGAQNAPKRVAAAIATASAASGKTTATIPKSP